MQYLWVNIVIWLWLVGSSSISILMLQIELQNCKIGIEVSKLEFHFVQYKYFHCLTKLLNWSGNRYSTLKVLVEAVKNCIWPTICPDGHYYPALTDTIILPWRTLLSCPDGHYYPALTDIIILPWRTLLSRPDGHYYPALTDIIILPWRTLLSCPDGHYYPALTDIIICKEMRNFKISG
jgi:hypothetical protein